MYWNNIENPPEDGQNVIVSDGNIVVPSTYNKRLNQYERYNNSIEGDRVTIYYYPNIIKWTHFPSPNQ